MVRGISTASFCPDITNFQSRGIKTFRTDNQGTIVAYSDGKNITWNVSPDTTWTPGEPKGSSSNWNSSSKNISKGKSGDSSKNTSKTQVSYVINEDTGKFHLPSCRFVKQMNEENRITSSKSRNTLIKEGYEACKVCEP